ncbi:hypothetical protein [Rudanella lutea]|uniref:hypothetical protein n=1 Tax=Rudanella lutea TaxID=451374 RepID=UPI000363DEA8|nr:hypothetical protein [Rudanella lutea]
MKSIVALLLATLILGSSTLPIFSIDQSARWAQVLRHYEQHQQENPQLGFIDFLSMHYGADSEHQKHPNHCHHDMPLVGHSVPVFPPAILGFSASPLVQIIPLAQALFKRQNDLYSFLGVFSLINPPRR